MEETGVTGPGQPSLNLSELLPADSSPVTVMEKDITDLWRSLAVVKGLSTDADVARFLLAFYHLKKDVDDPYTARCSQCQNVLMLCCLKCPVPSQTVSPLSSQQSIVPTDTSDEHWSQEVFPQLLQSSACVTQPLFLQPSVKDDCSPKSPSECVGEEEDGDNCEGEQDINYIPENDGAESDTDEESKKQSNDIDNEITSNAHAVENSENTSVDAVNRDWLNTKPHVTVDEFMTGRYPVPTRVVSGRQCFSHFLCDRCKQVFTSESVFKYHSQGQHCMGTSDTLPPHALETLKQIQRKLLYLCAHCSFLFASEESYREHASRFHEEGGSHRCQSCGMPFADVSRLEEHVKRFKVKDKVCQKCGVVFISKCHEKQHLESHERAACVFACNFCSEKFRTKREKARHMKIKHKFRCSRCPATFGTRQERAQHYQSYKHFLCASCGKGFITQWSLDAHAVVHCEERNFPCSSCSYIAKSKQRLLVHIHNKHNEKKHQCEFCGAKFSTASILDRHLQKHTGKRFSCEDCGARFARQAYLDAHRRKHTGERPFVCKTCGKSFVSKTYLSMHMGLHLSKRPHKCEFCPATFKRRDYLRKHRRLHTGERPYQCKVCSKCFIDATVLKNHKRKYHPDIFSSTASATLLQCD